MITPTGEAPKRRGVRTDNSVKKLPNGKGGAPVQRWAPIR